jgi:TPR repeat protein
MKLRLLHVFLLLIWLLSGLVFAEEGSFEKIKMQAEKGDATAQFKLGVMYFNGQETAQNYKEALKWFQRAAEQQLPEAQYNVGLMYYEGKGASQNFTEALKWFNKAAEQNNPKAQYNLGVMYSLGEGVPQDNVKAYMWLSLAYSNGFEQAQNNILLLDKVMTASEMEKAAAQAAEIKKGFVK